MRIKELNVLATELIGDGKTPNLFFVSIKGDIVLVTPEFDTAHEYWLYLPRTIETALEDRRNGMLAATEPEEDGSNVLRTYDNSTHMLHLRS